MDPEALKNNLASLKIKEEIGDKEGISISIHNIGSVYEAQGNYPEALKNYLAPRILLEKQLPISGAIQQVLWLRVF